MKAYFLIPAICAAVLFSSCASTEDAKKKEKQTAEENIVVEKARESWKKFAAEREAEERNRHSMTTLQNDKIQVFPWRNDDKRRSENMHDEQHGNSMFKFW